MGLELMVVCLGMSLEFLLVSLVLGDCLDWLVCDDNNMLENKLDRIEIVDCLKIFLKLSR